MKWIHHQQIGRIVSGEKPGQQVSNNSWVHPKFNFKKQYYAFPFYKHCKLN